MDLSEYNKRSGDLFDDLQEKLEDYEDVIDYDFGQGKLVIHVEGHDAPYVINTQQAALQIWMAGEALAWHYDWDAAKQVWFDEKHQVELLSCLSDRLSKLADEPIKL